MPVSRGSSAPSWRCLFPSCTIYWGEIVPMDQPPRLLVCSFAFPTGNPWKHDELAAKLVLLVSSRRSAYSSCLLFQDSLDAMLQWLLQRHHQEEVLQAGLCTEGALLLLEMLKATMSQVRPIPHMLPRGGSDGKASLEGSP